MRVLEQRSTKFHCLVIKCLDQSPFSEWPRIEWLNWGELRSCLPKGMGYDPQSGMGGGNINHARQKTKIAHAQPVCCVLWSQQIINQWHCVFLMAPITANVTFVRWSIKCKQSCLVWGRWKMGKRSTSAPPWTLRQYFKEILESVGVGCGERGRGVYLHTLHIPLCTQSR